jgi:putative Holliday junction resolvase
VAVSDESGLIATPLTVIRRASKAQDFAQIARLAREQGVGGLVIGHPLNAVGGSTPQAQRVERYASALAQALEADGLDLPMTFWDESLSTRRAQEAMIVSGRKVKDRQARIDAVAAAVILQDFLEARRSGAPGRVEEEDGWNP